MEQIINILENELNEVLEGNKDALELFINLRKIIDLCSSIQTKIEDSAKKEFDVYNQNEIEKFGAKIGISKGGRYDYKDIKVWNKYKKILSNIEKTAQKAFQTNQAIETDYFGLIEPAIYSKNKESIKISFK